MKLCTKEGNGVCLNCPKNLPNSWGDVCRYDAEMLLDCLQAIIDTEWTYEQEQIFADFGIGKEHKYEV
jgi:hypothetical protein